MRQRLIDRLAWWAWSIPWVRLEWIPTPIFTRWVTRLHEAVERDPEVMIFRHHPLRRIH